MASVMRERWSSRALFIFAAMGSAIGLGNIWRFPYLTYEYGGGAFLIAWVLGLIVLAIGLLSRKVRTVPTWTCGEVQDNDQMIIPGTHFYKTVSSMSGLKQFYAGQEKGNFDLYNQGGRAGMALTNILKWLHSGILPMYLTWVTIGLLIIIFVLCKI